MNDRISRYKHVPVQAVRILVMAMMMRACDAKNNPSAHKSASPGKLAPRAVPVMTAAAVTKTVRWKSGPSGMSRPLQPLPSNPVSPVRLDEIGEIRDSVENDRIYTWRDDTRAIVLAVQRQPGTNTVAVVDNIKKLLPIFEKQIPASVELRTLYDRSISIRESVEDVKLTLALTIGLVILVIFLFLRSATATFIPDMALPMSIIVTFGAMYFFGFSIDNLSLMAL